MTSELAEEDIIASADELEDIIMASAEENEELMDAPASEGAEGLQPASKTPTAATVRAGVRAVPKRLEERD
jgi:hypothetical protein